ncbi:MAG: hypothetical protein U9N53_04290 [Bacteroidota bacterium]|nr:hypothetical protein [Bacteroidota bacterium]
MKKNIVRLIFPSFLFIVMLGFGMNMNFSPEKESFINEALAQSNAGRLCANISTQVCIWYNEDGSIDYMDNGDWMPEQE